MPPNNVELPLPDSSVTDRGERFVIRLSLTRGQLVVLALHVIIFCAISWLPLPALPVWGQILQGRELWLSGRIPLSETLLPLAAGMPFVQFDWGADLAAYAASCGGIAGLKLLYSAAVVAGAWGVYQHSRFKKCLEFSASGASLCLVFLIVCSTGPFHGACVGMVFLLAVDLLLNSPSRLPTALIPIVFVVWANVDPTFLIGLAWLGITLLTTWLTASDRSNGASDTRQCRHSIGKLALIFELSAAATLFNPYGPWLYPAVFRQLTDLRLEAIGFGGPLSIRTLSGLIAMLLYLLTMVCTLRGGDADQRSRLLPLTALGFAAAWNERFMPIWAIVLSPALAQAMSEWFSATRQTMTSQQTSPTTSRGNILHLVIAGAVIWIGFSFSSIGAAWLSSNKPLDPRSQLAADVPSGAAQYLRDNPPRTLIFNPAEWGDYLLLNGPVDLQVFAHSAVDRLPVAVWAEYQAIARAQSGAAGLLDRYGIDTVVIDSIKSQALAEELRAAGVWRPVFRDERSVIFERRASTP